jgi:hypothetical protein
VSLGLVPGTAPVSFTGATDRPPLAELGVPISWLIEKRSTVVAWSDPPRRPNSSRAADLGSGAAGRHQTRGIGLAR